MIFAMEKEKKYQDVTGFTAVELLIVIAVIGLMSAVAVPSLLSYMPKSRLNGAARTVAGDLMSARMAAVKKNCKAIVEFETASRYCVVIDENSNNTCDPGERKIIKDLGDNFKDVVNIKADTKNIFNSRGTATRMRNIILKNPSGERTIRVSIAGRVKIE
jgi:prepilin-type N-terminal cleavage/methylation domain-containing protein